MKILITGASGMLGTDLVSVLRLEHDVHGVGRRSAPVFKNYTSLDLTSSENTLRYFNQIKPDLVIHAAAYTRVDDCESKHDEAVLQNVVVTKNIVEACNQVGAFLYFFSTDYVFSGQKKDPYLENDPIQPVNFYGQTKAQAEKVIQDFSNQFQIFRVTWLYGEKGNHFPGAILKQAALKDEIPVVSDQWGRPTWTDDLAQTFLRLLQNHKSDWVRYNKSVYHIGNDDVINWSGYARKILDQCGYLKTRIREITTAELARPATRPINSVLCLDKAKNELGIQMRPWQDALGEFLRNR